MDEGPCSEWLWSLCNRTGVGRKARGLPSFMLGPQQIEQILPGKHGLQVVLPKHTFSGRKRVRKEEDGGEQWAWTLRCRKGCSARLDLGEDVPTFPASPGPARWHPRTRLPQPTLETALCPGPAPPQADPEGLLSTLGGLSRATTQTLESRPVLQSPLGHTSLHHSSFLVCDYTQMHI